jgi:hypothetical protein
MLGLTLPPDTTPPTITATFDPAQPDADGIYRRAVMVTLAGADDRPGVVVEYQLDGGPWTTYARPVAIISDGMHTIAYRATDAAGNRSEVGSRTLRIDKPSEVDGDVIGSVPATLSLALGAPPSFGRFQVGVAQTYTAAGTATVTSSAGDAALTVADPSNFATGRLLNGQFALTQPLQVRAGTGAFAPLGGLASPTALLAYGGPVSSSPVALEFRQSIGANEALRTGAYTKTLTFTLSTTTP